VVAFQNVPQLGLAQMTLTLFLLPHTPALHSARYCSRMCYSLTSPCFLFHRTGGGVPERVTARPRTNVAEACSLYRTLVYCRGVPHLDRARANPPLPSLHPQIVAFQNVLQLGLAQMSLTGATRIAQCSSLTISSTLPMPMQVSRLAYIGPL
jgi:hypothetical protein